MGRGLMNEVEQAVLRVVLAWTKCPDPLSWDEVVERFPEIEGESRRSEKQRLASRHLAIWELGDRIQELSRVVLLAPLGED